MPERLLIIAGLLISLFCNARQSQADPSLKILIIPDTVSGEEINTYTIRRCLADLVYENDRDRNVYDSVFDCQTIYETSYAESYIYDQNKLLGLDDTVKNSSDTRISRNKAYQNMLLRVDEVLYVRMTSGKPGSETSFWTFSLYSVVPDKEKTIPVLILKKSEGCTVDSAADNYDRVLCATIAQVCTAANIAPQVYISSNAVRTTEGLYMAKGDTLFLRLRVHDPDTKRERIRYRWSLLPHGSGLYPAVIRRTDSTQCIVLKQEGILVVTVQASDRIVDSEPDTMVIHVIPRPVIVRYFKGSFVKIGKASGRITHPFDDLYQPYLFSHHTDIIEFNRHYIWTDGNRQVDIGLVFTDSAGPDAKQKNVSHEFKIEPFDSVFMIKHEARVKLADTFYYNVTLTDHGIKARPLTIEQIYRKAAPFYITLGLLSGRFKPAEEKFNVYSTAGIGFFLHPHVHLEYAMEFPFSDSLFGRGQIWKYPNHRTTIMAPLPFRFNNRGLLISLVYDLLLFRYPNVSKGLYTGMGLGANMRMLYNPFPWLGTTYHIEYTFIRDVSWQNIPNRFFTAGIGFILIPVRK